MDDPDEDYYPLTWDSVLGLIKWKLVIGVNDNYFCDVIQNCILTANGYDVDNYSILEIENLTKVIRDQYCALGIISYEVDFNSEYGYEYLLWKLTAYGEYKVKQVDAIKRMT